MAEKFFASSKHLEIFRDIDMKVTTLFYRTLRLRMSGTLSTEPMMPF
jgi:hypothetical protein